MIAARTAAGDPDNAAVLEGREQRAVVMDAMGRLEESHAEWRALAEEFRRLHGPGHPIRSRRAVTLGPDHPDTLQARGRQDAFLRQKKPRPRGNYPV